MDVMQVTLFMMDILGDSLPLPQAPVKRGRSHTRANRTSRGTPPGYQGRARWTQGADRTDQDIQPRPSHVYTYVASRTCMCTRGTSRVPRCGPNVQLCGGLVYKVYRCGGLWGDGTVPPTMSRYVQTPSCARLPPGVAVRVCVYALRSAHVCAREMSQDVRVC